MKFKVLVRDTDINEESKHVIEVRKNTSMKTVVLKAVEKHVDNYSDPTDFMREVKSINRECEDLEELIDDLKQELDLSILIVDLNNNSYYNKKDGTHTTSYNEGYHSYELAWRGQLNEEDGEQNLKAYLPDVETIIEHGNELTSEQSFLDNWELESD